MSESRPPAPAVPVRKPPLPSQSRAWSILLLLGAAGFLFRFDRQVLSTLKTTISSDLNFSNTDYALLVAAFMLTYAGGYLFSGRLIDRWGTRATLWLFVSGMSLATIATGIATTFRSILSARLLLGIFAAGVMPAVLVAVTRWFPVERRAVAFTLQSALHNCGAIFAPPIIAGITLFAGWPVAFILPGIVGLGVALALRITDTSAPLSAVSGTHTVGNGLLSIAPLRRLILARMCSDPLWFFLFYWQSAFLQERIGLSLAEVGQWTWIPPAFSVVATLVLGGLNDWLVRRGESALHARLRLLKLITFLAPVTLLLPWIGNPVAAIAALTLVYVMCNAWLLLTNLLVSDLVPADKVGGASGLISACGGITSILFNLAAGPLVDAFGHTLILTAGALMHPAAWFLARGLGAGGLPQRRLPSRIA